MEELKQDWYFTFGMGQPHANKFIKIFGTFSEAREQMVNSFGQKWSFQYSEKEWFNKEGVSQEEQFHLTQIY